MNASNSSWFRDHRFVVLHVGYVSWVIHKKARQPITFTPITPTTTESSFAVLTFKKLLLCNFWKLS